MNVRSAWATATFLCGAMVAVVSGAWRPAQERVELNPGDAAPAFSLPGSDGKTHSLADYKGKVVVLAWFPKAFTAG